MFRRERWDRGLERKPRPSRDYIVQVLLPDPVGEDASSYAEAVAETAADFLFGLAGARRYLRYASNAVPSAIAARLPSPWRLQYLMQEQLDGYSGRYFLPTAPNPDGVLGKAEVPVEFNPPNPRPSLESIRHDWGALRVTTRAMPDISWQLTQPAAQAYLTTYIQTVVIETTEPLDGGLTSPR